MKIFVPANSSQDSVYLLYKLLSETDDEIVTRCMAFDSKPYELKQYFPVCEWLSSNIRNFDYGIVETLPPEIPETKDFYSYSGFIDGNNWYAPTHTQLDYNYAMECNKHRPDKYAIGFNTFNWHPTNFFFQANQKVEEFYKKDNPWVLGRVGVFMDYVLDSIDIEWTLMNENFCVGRCEVWDSIPEDLQKLVVRCSCNKDKCGKCASRKWFERMKSEGMIASEIDDLVMKEGRFGKYYTKESSVLNRHAAYINMV